MRRSIGCCPDFSHKFVFVVMPWVTRVFKRRHYIYSHHVLAVLRSSNPRGDCTALDTNSPRVFFRYESVDGWMRELNERIDADIRREEEAARRHMEFLCSLSHLVEE